jgi:hypothetical protein
MSNSVSDYTDGFAPLFFKLNVVSKRHDQFLCRYQIASVYTVKYGFDILPSLVTFFESSPLPSHVET